MSDLTIIIEVPEALVERAKAVGLQLDDQTGQIIQLLEDQIRRKEAGQRLRATMSQIDSLPDEMKPTPQEIDAEIRAYHAENGSQTDSDDV